MAQAHGDRFTKLEDHLKAWEHNAYAAWMTHISKHHGDYRADGHALAPHARDQHREAHAQMDEYTTLADVTIGTVLQYGAYGPMTVAKVTPFLGGWNGKVELVEIRFTTGMGFEEAADRQARVVRFEKA